MLSNVILSYSVLFCFPHLPCWILDLSTDIIGLICQSQRLIQVVVVAQAAWKALRLDPFRPCQALPAAVNKHVAS